MVEYKYSKNAKVLFVGINPHPGSFRRGVPFSNNKMFWYLLNRAGLLNESMENLKDDAALRNIYDTKFVPIYHLNFTNLVDRPTVDITELKKGEEEAGVGRLLETLRNDRPRVVCFIGKIAWTTFKGVRKCEWGRQEDIEGVPAYLMHFPLRGLAEVRVRELRQMSGVRNT